MYIYKSKRVFYQFLLSYFPSFHISLCKRNLSEPYFDLFFSSLSLLFATDLTSFLPRNLSAIYLSIHFIHPSMPPYFHISILPCLPSSEQRCLSVLRIRTNSILSSYTFQHETTRFTNFFFSLSLFLFLPIFHIHSLKELKKQKLKIKII